jgi:hypothetical protein
MSGLGTTANVHTRKRHYDHSVEVVLSKTVCTGDEKSMLEMNNSTKAVSMLDPNRLEPYVVRS